MFDNPSQPRSDDTQEQNDNSRLKPVSVPHKSIPDWSTEGGGAHPVFKSNAQPQGVNDDKIIGAPDPIEPVQAAATDTAATHPVFGSGSQPQDVYDEKIMGEPDPLQRNN